MMNAYLVFQLYAPLVSWGTQAVGQERPTEDHPGRSALLGLLAASLGIKRAEEARHQALSNSCKFGIKLYAPGLTMRDFHTAQVPPTNRKVLHLYTRRDGLRSPKLGTILSFRSYQQDALSLVAVTSDSQEYTLKILCKALQSPHFHLYFGRKSCVPATRLNPQIIESDSLRQALDHYRVGQELESLKALDKPHYYWEKMDHTGLTASYHVPRYDQPISRQRWQFARRDEYVSLGE